LQALAFHSISEATMAVVQIAFTAPEGIAPLAQAVPALSQTITTSGTSQATDIVSRNGGVCTITASGNNVWAAFGPSPTAAPNTHQLILSGQTRDFALGPGKRVAVIDAA
jgi:hypothetical protein